MKQIECGTFCETIGKTSKNAVIEFFIEAREFDHSIGDMAKQLGLNRATAYNVIEELLDEEIIVETRKISNTQLYKLNEKNSRVKLLIEMFNLILNKIKGDL